MSASDTVLPVKAPGPPTPGKRGRFAGERAGAWLFAASFSIGIWGLALKILSPGHPPAPPPTIPRYALLAPSGKDDGRATVVWATGEIEPGEGYPVVAGVPLDTLATVEGSDTSAKP